MTPVTASNFALAIISNASFFSGMRETKGNSEWKHREKSDEWDRLANLRLNKYMRAAPWAPGSSYCAAFAEAVWRMAADDLGLPGQSPQKWELFTKLMTAGCVLSFNNFDDNKPRLVHSTPAKGSIWLARHGTGSLGHAGIVIDFDASMMQTVEGNTSATAAPGMSQREGDGIYAKSRNQKKNGDLTTLGFVWPSDFV